MEDKAQRRHPYLAGNFAPITISLPLTPCKTIGTIPRQLAGGQYVRNGGNPVTNECLGRDAHWFDGDGMLSGVLFKDGSSDGDQISPEFVNQYILTDLYLASNAWPRLRTPILPSIATLVNPLTPLWFIILRIFRTVLLVIISHMPGSLRSIRKISVANTALYYHDGRCLATCESGPPMRVALPELGSIGWFNGCHAENETEGLPPKSDGFGTGPGIVGFMREWTTAHPRVDPQSGEMLLYHSTFIPPYVRYSIVPSMAISEKSPESEKPPRNRIMNRPIPGISSPKMMHDFGVSRKHTIIMDLPLSLDPLHLFRNLPVVAYDPLAKSRFGIFPRYSPEQISWFETKACCIFHTANCWDEDSLKSKDEGESSVAVNLLACRLTSASLVYSAGALAAPQPIHDIPAEDCEEDQCRLYFYQFVLPKNVDLGEDKSAYIRHEWALSAIPFEFPSVRSSVLMHQARFVYGCSVSDSSFGAALGRAVKINSLVKIDVLELIKRGIQSQPQRVRGIVDSRTVDEVLESKDANDPIKVFKLPDGWYAQEPRFVPRSPNEPGPIDSYAGNNREDDGWLLSYVFDESQLRLDGECENDAKSELWIVDARDMSTVVARILLPQRVPYGLHGCWFSQSDIQNQRPYDSLRSLKPAASAYEQIESGLPRRLWLAVRERIFKWIG